MFWLNEIAFLYQRNTGIETHCEYVRLLPVSPRTADFA